MIDASPNAPVSTYDAKARHDIGLLIKSYLSAHPAPKCSIAADELSRFAQQLAAAA